MSDLMINDLKERVDRMDTMLIETHNKAITNEVILGELRESNRRLVDSIENFVEVITQIKLTLGKMQIELQSNGNAILDVKNKMGEIEKKFEVSEEKAKIDWRIIIKDAFVKALPWLVAIGAIVASYIKGFGN